MRNFRNSSKVKILKSSIRLIEKNGLEQFSLRKLAENIKMDPMAVYHYYPSKDLLISACIHSVFENFCSEIRKQIEIKKVHKTKSPFLGRDVSRHHNLLFLLDAYRGKYVAFPNLCRYLLNHPHLSIAEIEEFNEILMKEINKSGAMGEKSILVRDILIDFIHGFSLAEITALKKNKIQNMEMNQKFYLSLTFLIQKILQSESNLN